MWNEVIFGSSVSNILRPVSATFSREGPRGSVVFDVVEHGGDRFGGLAVLHDQTATHVQNDAHGTDVDGAGLYTGLATCAGPELLFSDVVPEQRLAVAAQASLSG